MAIGRYMHNIHVIDCDLNLFAQTLAILSIIPIWYWCMNYE